MITSWQNTSPSQKTSFLNQLREIFFLSSARKTFQGELEKESFFQDWTSHYFETQPDRILLAVDSQSKVLGYLMGTPDSKKALPHYKERVKSYEIFQDMFDQYPAHLHINLHPESRGLGLGTTLVGHFVKSLKDEAVRGLHIVTSPTSQNVSFYRRNGFDFEENRPFNGTQLLFMGRSL